MARYQVVTLLLVAGMVSGCVTPAINETTGPAITFFLLNGQQTLNNLALPYNARSNAPITLFVRANDPGGVRSLGLNFDNNLGDSNFPSFCYINGTQDTGGYLNPQISSAFATSSPNSQGQVPTALFTASTIQGPFTCDLPYIGTGTPSGFMEVTAFATNYSNLTTSATMYINFSR